MKLSRDQQRMVILMGLLVAGFGALGYRLVQLQWVQAHELRAEVSQIHGQVLHRQGRRGAILDARGNLLANSQSVQVVVADPQFTRPVAADLARQLAPLLQMPEAELVERLSRTSRYVRLKQRVDWDTAQAIRALRARGIFFEDQYQRVYPNGPLGCHVIGFVDAQHRGVQGIEATMDTYLNGRAGYEIIERDRKGRELRAWRHEALGPRDGLTVRLTLDQVVQHVVDTELDRAMEKHRPHAGMVIVSRPRTGEILAMASRPHFDPNQPGAVPADARRNRCISDVAEPGSTFKVAIIAAALNDGIVSLVDRVDCENGAFIYAGRALHDAHPHGVLTVEEVLYRSSNIGTAKVALKMGPNRLYEYLRAFGFGQRTGIELVGEVGGILHPLSRWTKLSITRIPMGHEVAVTPLQMMMAFNAVVNGGRLMRPRLVQSVEDTDGRRIMEFGPQMVRQVITPRASVLTVSALRKVVTDQGTAPRAAVTGYDVAGKTGTAQKIENGQYVRRYYSTFVGCLPASDPEVSILVTLDDPSVGGYYGGTVAGPVFRAVAEKIAPYLGVPASGQQFQQGGWS